MDKKKCPSAPFKEGNSVFALFEENTLRFTEKLKKIDSSLFEKVGVNRDKSDYRATMPCVTKGCGNWDGEKCTVPDQMRYYLQPLEDITAYRSCPIQQGCRWYAQEGQDACRICPLIRTKHFQPELQNL